MGGVHFSKKYWDDVAVAVCCSVLQCVEVCYSVLQCVTVCCSVLQCVAVCCSVLQFAATSWEGRIPEENTGTMLVFNVTLLEVSRIGLVPTYVVVEVRCSVL